MCGFSLTCGCFTTMAPSSRGRSCPSNASIEGSKYTFSFTRLNVNGVPEGDQPFAFGRLGLGVCNGEIYNHKKLEMGFNDSDVPETIKDSDMTRQDLMDTCDVSKGLPRGDCEVVFKMIMKYGFTDAAVALGPSEYAWAFQYDKDIYLARDCFGVRPLYTGRCCKCMALCAASTHSELMNFPNVIGIEQFPPGHAMKYNTETGQSDLYDFRGELMKSLPEEPTLADAISDAVHDRITLLDTSQPIGVLLSGGIDSCTVLIETVREVVCKWDVDDIDRIHAFTFATDDTNTDVVRAKALCHRLGVKLSIIPISVDDVVSNIEDTIVTIGTFDTTTVRASAIQLEGLRKVACDFPEVKVLLTGEGADEMFAGYLYFSRTNDGEQRRRECHRLLENIHFYDGLRVDRSAGKFALEVRPPLLDPRVAKHMSETATLGDYAMSDPNVPSLTKLYFRKCMLEASFHQDPSDLELAMHEAYKDMEGWHKDALSDSVGSEIVQRLRDVNPDLNRTLFKGNASQWINRNFPHMTPRTPEELHYRTIFERHCHALSVTGTCPEFWHHRFSKAGESVLDPSARCLDNYPCHTVPVHE